jgi:hypothetical protein
MTYRSDLARYNALVDAFVALEPVGTDPNRFRFRSKRFMSTRGCVRIWLMRARDVLGQCDGGVAWRFYKYDLVGLFGGAERDLSAYADAVKRPPSRRPYRHNFGSGDLHYHPG